MRQIWILAVLLSGLGVASAWAIDDGAGAVINQRITVYGGIQYYQAEGTFRSTEAGRPEIEVDLDTLNLDDNEISPIFGMIFNFGKRWSLRLDYFGYHDDADATAEYTFDFEDLVVPVGARMESSLDMDIIAANLAYNFIHTDRARFGFGVGFHVADIELGISAKLKINDKEISLGDGSADLLAPVPNLYAYGAYAFTDQFLMRYGGGWMSLNYGDFDGSLVFANAYLEYWPFPHAGFGAGYRYVDADIDYDSGSKTEKYDVTLPGPVVYVSFGF